MDTQQRWRKQWSSPALNRQVYIKSSDVVMWIMLILRKYSGKSEWRKKAEHGKFATNIMNGGMKCNMAFSGKNTYKITISLSYLPMLNPHSTVDTYISEAPSEHRKDSRNFARSFEIRSCPSDMRSVSAIRWSDISYHFHSTRVDITVILPFHFRSWILPREKQESISTIWGLRVIQILSSGGRVDMRRYWGGLLILERAVSDLKTPRKFPTISFENSWRRSMQIHG